MSEKIYWNGELVSIHQATIPISNPSFLHGVGLFETLRAYNGKPFRLAQHVDRLKTSAKHFHIPINTPIGDAVDRISAAVQQVLEANHLSDARVRVTLTPPGSTDEPDLVTLLVRAEATRGYPPELYEAGMNICVVNRFRQSSADPLVGHKTTSYFSRLLALRDAQDRQCGEGLWFTPDNRLAQGCMSNVFLVCDGILKTPPVDTPVLPGITRATVIELARDAGITVEETACTIDDLLKAQEIFLTNCALEIMPVTHIERHNVGTEKMGDITRRLIEAYKAAVNA